MSGFTNLLRVAVLKAKEVFTNLFIRNSSDRQREMIEAKKRQREVTCSERYERGSAEWEDCVNRGIT